MFGSLSVNLPSRRNSGPDEVGANGNGDVELYRQLFGAHPSVEISCPLHFATPVAPPIAAEREGGYVDLGRVWQAFQLLGQQRDFLLVEALGGLGSPVTAELTVAHLAADWRLDAVLAVPVHWEASDKLWPTWL